MNETVDKIQAFLEANYPCKCDKDDPTCPGEKSEAEAIWEIVYPEIIGAFELGQTTGMDDAFTVVEIVMGLREGPPPGPSKNPYLEG